MDSNFFMDIAIKEAIKSFNKGEVPIGAIIVINNKIISKGHNLVETTRSQLYHAESIAIKKANNKLKTWRLENSTIYSTLEPCIMCIGLINLSRIERLIFGLRSHKFGFTSNISNDKIGSSYKKIKYIENGIRANIIEKLLKDFFKNKR
jgi:tRNA(adenine34) deaminase